MPKISKNHLAAMIGTTIEYYDMSLYGFLMPILVKLFFPSFDPITGTIIALTMVTTGFLIRPVGAFIIGRIGDKYGRKKALTIAILGMAVVTGLISLLPTYETIGIFAPILLSILRVMQAFFVAGEYNGGAIFVLEHNQDQKPGYLSGLYAASTVLGVTIASFVATIIHSLPAEYWRLPFMIAFITGIIGFYIRKNIDETPEFKLDKTEANFQFMPNYRNFIVIIITASFFTTLYYIQTIFMLNLLPQITSIKTQQILLINSVISIIYMILLPIFGMISDKISYIRLMKISCVICLITIIPLFYLINFGLYGLILFKLATFTLCAAYIAPYHAFAQKLFVTKNRYVGLSLAFSIGAQVGAYMPALCLYLWRDTHNIYIPAFIILFFSGITIVALGRVK